jgi:hypothetical protein
LAFDYGINTLLTGGTPHLTGGFRPQVFTDRRPVFFRPTGALAKERRLRAPAERLRARADHPRRLMEGRTAAGLPADPRTAAKHQALTVEHTRVSARREHLNRAVARAAASFMADHARAVGASVIYLEDLREMEARARAAASAPACPARCAGSSSPIPVTSPRGTASRWSSCPRAAPRRTARTA